jgi:hypothetical protein
MVNKSELDGPGSFADKILTYLQSCPDISLYCVYDQYKMNLLSTRNKGCPTTKEEAEKKKEHKCFGMIWLSDFHNPQEDTGPSEEVHTVLTSIDKDSYLFDALKVQEALRVEDGK